jgi:hypothetical protein
MAVKPPTTDSRFSTGQALENCERSGLKWQRENPRTRTQDGYFGTNRRSGAIWRTIKTISGGYGENLYFTN